MSSSGAAAAAASPSYYDFFVGTFNTPQLYTLRFTPPASSSSTTAASVAPEPSSLEILHRSPAIGSHSWLHLSPPIPRAGSTSTSNSHGPSTRNLYATAWTEPLSVVAYAVESSTSIRLLGQATTHSRSGYVTASQTAVYSAGGATGEVFALDAQTGGFVMSETTSKSDNDAPPHAVTPLQRLSFIDSHAQRDDGSVMDFGGLRHGAHSADLSPSGDALYVADIGRNCIWSYAVDRATGKLRLAQKYISPRPNDGPRHVWPHPNGKVVYVLQEHTSMVDVFTVEYSQIKTEDGDGVENENDTAISGPHLTHVQGVRIIPAGADEADFWADEVRTSLSDGDTPRWLYASTRGLTEQTKGYVAVFRLDEHGLIDQSPPVTAGSVGAVPAQEPAPAPDADADARYNGLRYIYTTPTSGGWANAVQPGPTVAGVEYIALTDSEQGFVFVLAWDGMVLSEAARTKLDEGAGAATAVWL